jgi:hypothetical protein
MVSFDTTFMEKHFWILRQIRIFDLFFDLPSRTFHLKTSLFHQIHPPKFHFSGSITHKLTFKTKIGKVTCILEFFRSCQQKLNFLYEQFFFSKIHRQLKTFTKFKNILDFGYWSHHPSNKTPAMVICYKKFKNAPP